MSKNLRKAREHAFIAINTKNIIILYSCNCAFYLFMFG